jgi:CubicO group peptidase (beta-lactamase class C family)
VLRFVEALESRVGERAAVHSMMLLRHGCVIAEGWWAPYTAQQPHLLFSLSKSFTATAVGLAVAEGRLSLDDPVASFFPDAAAHSDGLAALRVRHLLSMSTGQAADTWSFMVDRADGDWIAGFLGVPIVHPPGTQFLYNTGATYMLSAIVQQVTGLKLVDYLQPRLFAPLGIENAAWTESPQAITAGGIGLSLTTEDVARFGQLYLQKGVWHGTPIVPETWVGQATAFQIANSGGMQPDWTQGYGYQFWRCRHNAYRGDGVFGQYCIVMPEQDAVLAITAGLDVFAMQQPLDHVWEILLPAMGAARIADDPAAHAALTAKLAHLSLPPVTGARTSSAVAQVSGRAYAVEANPLGIGTLLFDFAADACTLHIGTAAGEHVIAIGYGGWRAGGPTALFQQPLLFERTPVAVSGAWTAEDVFTVIVHLTATPFCYTLTCQFSGDSVLIEKVISVSLDSMEPLLLLGTLERPAQR